jgi:acyl carrier protein
MAKDIYPIVKEIIAQYLGIDPARVVPEAEFIKDLDADSLDVVELVMAIEDKFDIEVADFVAAKIVRVQDLLEYLELEINSFG